MALHFPLMVNSEMIGRFVAQRREPTVPADRICTYDVTVELKGKERTAVVRHNYDAGALGLIRAGLSAVNLMLDGPPALEPAVLSRGKVRTLYRADPPMQMPVFPIKAKDALAVLAVGEYQSLCLEHGLVAQADQVQLAIEEMSYWQNANPDQVHWPDHTHVPAGFGPDPLPPGQHCPSCDGHSCPDVG